MTTRKWFSTLFVNLGARKCTRRRMYALRAYQKLERRWMLAADLAPIPDPTSVGYGDSLVIASRTGTRVDDSPISVLDEVYIDTIWQNIGDAPTGTGFNLKLEVDDEAVVNQTVTALNAGAISGFLDVSVGRLPLGVHTIEMTLDDGNVIAENSETNNTRSRSLTVAAADTSGAIPLTIPTADILAATSSTWGSTLATLATAFTHNIYSFSVATRAGIFFDVDAIDTGLTTTLDPILTLLNSAGEILISNDDGWDFEGFDAPSTSAGSATAAGFLDPALYLDLDIGTYFVAISGVNGTVGDYELRTLADTTYSATPPIFESLPGAGNSLYLDLDGHASSTDCWAVCNFFGSGINGPYVVSPFDLNGNGAEFSPGERLAIANLWRTTAEDYSPFDINITTVEPASLADGVGLRMVVTDSDGTSVGSAGALGVALLNSYATTSGADNNVAFTFAGNYSTYGAGPSGAIMAASVEQGNTASHEFGHTLGLRHYRTMDSALATQEAGAAAIIPNALMATPDFGFNRELWATGTAGSGPGTESFQDDVAVIANTIGYRSDDHGSVAAAATVLAADGNQYNSIGVIAELTDTDWFSFTASGETTIMVDVDEYINNLDTELRLYQADGTTLVQTSSPAASFDATIMEVLAPGNYLVEVRSAGEAGQQGQYRLSIATVEVTVNETLVSVDGNNQLTVSDIAGADSDDQITISVAPDPTKIRIHDPDLQLAINANAIAAGAIQVDSHTIDVPVAAITAINVLTAGGNDSITIDSIPQTFAGDITVDGQLGLDVVNINGSLTVAENRSLSVSADSILLPSTASDIITSGSGTVTFTADRDILLASGSSISTTDGGITLSANASGSANGASNGISASGAALMSIGTGNIALFGQGTDDLNSGNSYVGIELTNTSVTSTSTDANAGSITMIGIGAENDVGSSGVRLLSANTLISSVSGDITITGTGTAGTGAFIYGIKIDNIAGIRSTGLGAFAADVTISGTGGGTTQSSGVLIRNGSILSTGGDIAIVAAGQSGNQDLLAEADSQIGGPLTTGSIEINSDSIDLDVSTSIQSSGALIIRPRIATTQLQLGRDAVDVGLQLDDQELSTLAPGFSEIIIGDPVLGTGIINIDDATFTSPVSIVGGSISVTELSAVADSTPRAIILTARTGAITDGGDNGVDITAASLVATAHSGIGTNANAIETSVAQLEASGGSGGINLANANALIVGGISEFTGLSATGGNVNISSSASLTINEWIVNSGGGDIALSTIGTGDITISANTAATGGNGKISVNSAGNLGIDNDAQVSTVGSGELTATAERSIAITSATGTTTLQTVNGNLELVANINENSGNFAGLSIVGADITTGLGSITLAGTSGTTSQNRGIHIAGGSKISSTGLGEFAGTIRVDGKVANNSAFRAVEVSGSGTLISTFDADIEIVGSAINTTAITIQSAKIRSTGVGTHAGNISLSGNLTVGGASVKGVLLSQANTSIETVDGDISIQGNTPFGTGVHIQSTLLSSIGVAANAGNISITGTMGDGNFDQGVQILSSQVETIDGDVNINGTSATRVGTFINTLSSIVSSGTGPSSGTITITGSTSASNDAGLSVIGSSSSETTLIQSAAGDIALTGTSNGQDGLRLLANSEIHATGNSNIFLSGHTTGSGNGIEIHSNLLSEAGDVSLLSSRRIEFFSAGAITSTGGAITVDSGTADFIMADTAKISAGSGLIDIHADTDVTVGSLQTTGNVQIESQFGGILDGGDTSVDITAANLMMTAADGIGSNVNSIETAVDTIRATLSGGGLFVDEIDGMIVHTVSVVANENVSISTGDGQLELAANESIATGGTGAIVLQSTRNILIPFGSSVSTVDGDLTLIANASGSTGGSFSGIRVNGGSVITNGNGSIEMSATGGTATSNYGVLIDGGAVVSSTKTTSGAGSITIAGIGRIASGSNGTRIQNSNSVIKSHVGAIDISGIGATSTGLVVTANAVIQSLGSGASAATLSLTGSSTSTNDGDGVVIANNALVTSADGSTTINGTTLGRHGVSLFGNAAITSTGTDGNSATITINGKSGSHAAGSGVQLRDSDTRVDSQRGVVQIDADGDDGLYGLELFSNARVQLHNASLVVNATGGTASGIYLSSASSGRLLATGDASIVLNVIQGALLMGANSIIGGATASGDITLVSDNVLITGGTIQSTGDLIVRPTTASTSIGIGGGTGALDINDAVLATIASGFNSISIGQPGVSTGDVTVDTATFHAPVTISGGTIYDSANGVDITAPSVTLAVDVSPGMSPGVLSIAGNATISSGKSVQIEFASAGNYDQVTTTGRFDIDTSATLLLSAMNGFVPSTGQSFTIINRNGGSGTFAGLAEGATLPNFLGQSGLDAVISYIGGDGDDVVIATEFVPSLTLELSQRTISEATGLGATTATIRRTGDLSQPLTVTIINPNTHELGMPLSVTFNPTVNETTFTIDGLRNDGDIDGDLSGLVITASAPGFSDATDTLTITDDDTPLVKTLGGHLDGTIVTGDYIVLADLLVDIGDVMTIEPGSVLRFGSNIGMTVAGRLLAEGTDNSQIVFTSSQAAPAAGDWNGITLTSDSNQARSVLDNVEVAYGKTGVFVNPAGTHPQVSIQYSEIHHNFDDGIAIRTTANETISTNDVVAFANNVHHNGRDGVAVWSLSGYSVSSTPRSSVNNATIHKNEIHNNQRSGLNIFAATATPGFGAGVKSSSVVGSSIESNYVYGNANGVTLQNQIGFTISFSPPNSFQTIANTRDSSSVTAKLVNNLIVENASNGIELITSALNAPNTMQPEIVNNTITANGAAGIFHTEDIEPDTIIRNNIISGNDKGLRSEGPYTPDSFKVGYNLISGNTNGNFVNYPTSYGLTVGFYSSGDPYDHESNLNVDPGFVSPTDWHLSFDSPAIDRGWEFQGTLTDINGDARDSQTDIGADEVRKFTVTTLADENDSFLGLGSGNSLREVFNAANAGEGTSIINFAAGLNGGTITLGGSQLPQLTSSARVTGPGAGLLSISGNALSRVMSIASGETVELSGLTITNGRVNGGNGGAIHNAGTLSLSDVVVSNSHATTVNFGSGIIAHSAGGGIYSTGPLSIIDSHVTGNSVDENGGGISQANNTLSLLRSVVSDNDSGELGGGLFASSSPNLLISISDSTFDGNQAGTHGGGIYTGIQETLHLERSTISNNFSNLDGGGIFNGLAAVASIVNTTLSGNSANHSGGGIRNLGNLTITNSTITANVADADNDGDTFGGGINGSGTESLYNTIIAGNFIDGLPGLGSPHDVFATVETARNVLLGDPSSTVGITGGVDGNLVGVDPLLGPLQDNGGLTLTHALNLASPAIDAGNNTFAIDHLSVALVDDQRGGGFDRIKNAIVDMGALESDVQPPSVTLAVNPAEVAENGGVATLAATLSELTAFEVQVNLILSGTAIDGTDYSSPIVITIPAGSLTRSIDITAINDSLIEGNESIIVDIHTVTNAIEIGQQQVSINIIDDDNAIAPLVENVTINDGSATRSHITSLAVAFDSEVDPTNLASAFTLTNIDTNQEVQSLVVVPTNSGGKTTVRLTFGSGLSVVDRGGTGAFGNSLASGNYRLDIDAAQVRTASGATAMLADYVFGGQTANQATNDDFFRLFGDDSGDGFVDGLDFNEFLASFANPGNFNGSFDSNGDGFIDGTDLNDFLPTLATSRQ